MSQKVFIKIFIITMLIGHDFWLFPLEKKVNTKKLYHRDSDVLFICHTESFTFC